jgi:hypothetical protein
MKGTTMKKLLTITGEPATKAAVTKEITTQLAKNAAGWLVSHLFVQALIRAMIK